MAEENRSKYHPFLGLDHSGPDTAHNVADRLEDRINTIADTCASFPQESKLVDPRAWRHLMIYIPRAQIEAHLKWKDDLEVKRQQQSLREDEADRLYTLK